MGVAPMLLKNYNYEVDTPRVGPDPDRPIGTRLKLRLSLRFLIRSSPFETLGMC
jgi:hypothetical protein